MTPRTSTRGPGPRTRALLGAAALALGASACSGVGDPSAAAVIDGRVISESDVQTVSQELPPELTQGAPVDPASVITPLLLSDVIRGAARELADGPVTVLASRDDARRFLQDVDTQAGRPPGEYSEPTLELVATQLTLNNLQQTDAAQPVLQQAALAFTEADVTINPRYGSLAEDGPQLVPTQHEWLPERPDAQALPEG